MSQTATSRPEIVIVGAGVIGVCAAFELSRAGHRVLLLDRDEPGSGASSGNASHLAVANPFPIVEARSLWQVPRMLADRTGPLRIDMRYLHRITPWLLRMLWQLRPNAWRHSCRGLRRLNDGSTAAWRRMLARIDASDLLRVEGSLLVCESAAGERDLRADVGKCEDWGVRAEYLDADGVRAREPALSSRIRGGLYFPDTGRFLDPLQTVQQVFRAAREAGCEFRQTDVSEISASDSGVRLTTGDGALEAENVLIATGAHGKQLVRQATGVKVPLDTERGYHLMLPGERDRLRLPVASSERRFVMTPLTGGLRLAGTVEFAGLERPADMRRARVLGEHAERMLEEGISRDGEDTWMGFRPTLPDCLPVIDRTGPGGRVLMAFGHHHLGLTQAAVTAEILRDLYHGESEPAIPVAPYRLDRFGTPARGKPETSNPGTRTQGVVNES